MFERGKKEEEINEGADTRPTVPERNFAAGSKTATRAGECAVIGQSIQIIGDLRGDEDLRIEGDVSGTVQLKNSNLTIGKAGKVSADVYAKSIVVDGTTEGDLYASERVSIRINAQVHGNITAPAVGIEEGARFKGSVEMDKQAVDKALDKANMSGAAKPAMETNTDKTGTAGRGSNRAARDAASKASPQAGVQQTP